MITQEIGNRIAVGLAAAIMLVMPSTIGFYLLRWNFHWWGLPPVVPFMGGCYIAIVGSALVAWIAYKVAIRFAASR
ncbi:hypothetical protein C7A10_28820 [Pseudomonas fluorescens]|uniref:Uncharacterized protein n=1 Tax=Pseudomonas fluorescens TaxID=294 RepID=A0A2T0HMY8_PSEFL|nr:hypothetical protein C7A10_28820 [Pseudomonas fluorescens]